MRPLNSTGAAAMPRAQIAYEWNILKDHLIFQKKLQTGPDKLVKCANKIDLMGDFRLLSKLKTKI